MMTSLDMPHFIFNDVLEGTADKVQVYAGTYVVLPADRCEIQLDDDGSAITDPAWPDYLMICCGQELSRELYPGWTAELDGGFYTFKLPNLVRKFILGFKPDGQPVYGTGCVYYKDVPEIPQPPSRDVLA